MTHSVSLEASNQNLKRRYCQFVWIESLIPYTHTWGGRVSTMDDRQKATAIALAGLVLIGMNFMALAPFVAGQVEAGVGDTIAAGYDSIKKKIELAKPEAKVTTPSTAATNALKKMNVSKIAIFTPYSKNLNNEVVDYFKKQNFIVTSNSYFDNKKFP